MSTTAEKVTAVDPSLLVDRQNMPYELDEGLGHRARIGLIVLASDHTIEYEFRILLDLPGVALYGSRISNSSTISRETLAAMEAGMAEAARVILPGAPIDVVAYGCTSGALVIGEENVHARIREGKEGVACTTPMEATFAAFRALGARRICFIPPYVDEINRQMRSHILANGFEVPVMGSWNISDDNLVSRLSANTVRNAVLELGRSEAVDAVFVSCTSIRLAEQVEALEAEIGKPVTSSNHALAWHCLRLAGIEDEIPGYGRLFRTGLAD
ncbi:MAG: Asp/Glu racemase [Gammaproteobacteria bacterium]|nr:Asp/Glu racemase [Gammaproteobacteria bacterium]